MRFMTAPMLAVATLTATFSPAQHTWAEEPDSQLRVSGDLRFRAEWDWDSRRANGAKRDDRGRARIRARIAVRIEPNDQFEFLTRFRTGSRASQQSPHVTVADFSGNPTGTQEVVIDKWYVKAKGKVAEARAWLWGGRNSLPFWKQNELLWDDDVTPAGVAGGAEFDLRAGKLAVAAGYLLLPDGIDHFHGNGVPVQFAYSGGLEELQWHMAAGVLLIDGEPGARNLRMGNGARDYTIWNGSLQVVRKFLGVPAIFGADVYSNSEGYSAGEIARDFSAASGVGKDDTDGFVLSLRVKNLGNEGQWQLGYYYADIEALAVHASYAQDDWMRWGSSSQTDASDFKGHEFRVGWSPMKNWQLLARLYTVEAQNSPQDGNRFRFDINWKF